ncbi:peptidoglycan DD-metalloendopeptidase family protein [Acetonema longum]|uniref:peptidoglycan DD-metalloendopeptidase family protein n=1 Tax=Acetonema longum TaxID=2374 RepID=UPI001112BCB5|nr:M23 family metallopeptidase [Acetonema longum]
MPSQARTKWFYVPLAAVLVPLIFWLLPSRHPFSEPIPLSPAASYEAGQGDSLRDLNVEQPLTATAKPRRAIVSHVVQAGETLSEIAERYDIDVDTILGANPETNELIHPGDSLIIMPQKGVMHTVNQGETLWDIAHGYGVDLSAITAANHKQDSLLRTGERLWIPGGKPRRSLAARSRYGRFIWPTYGEMTSLFGWRWGRLHSGIDIANHIGTIVMAAQSGRVSFAGWLGGYGRTIIIEHGQGFSTVYGHLSDYEINKGDYVAAGQPIAYMGNSGLSTGPHLHFEIRRNEEALDPLSLLP